MVDSNPEADARIKKLEAEVEMLEANMVDKVDYEQTVSAVVQAARDYRFHDKRRIEAALDGGRHLIEAKAAVQHGDFAALLERAELTPRTAQRWMKLARYEPALIEGGINPADFVREHGGINAVCDLLGKMRHDYEQAIVDPVRPDCPSCKHPERGIWTFPDGRCRSHLNAEEWEVVRRGMLAYL